jgi:hypothetical protein
MQSQVSAELQQLHDRELAAPAADAERLAAWQLDGERGDRPGPTLPAIKREIAERQADHEALTVAIGRVLDEKASYVDQHRRKLTRDADKDVEQAHRRYLELIEELVASREELSGLHRQAIWARSRGYDPRHKPGAVWSDDPKERAKRAERMAEWANRR